MKKLLFVLAVVVLFMGYATTTSFAQSTSSTGQVAETMTEGLEYQAYGWGVTITGYTGNATTLVIPAQIQEMFVTAIGDEAFAGCIDLTSITIPDSVHSIGDAAFWECWNLESITIPASVFSIGRRAFFWSGITAIDVDVNNLKYSSEDGVLYNKSKTKLISYPPRKYGHFTIPDSVIYIGNGAFEMVGLSSGVTIPNSVAIIGENAFSCSFLESITIPSSVALIGYEAFNGVFLPLESSLTSVTFERSNVALEFGAFPGDLDLKYASGGAGTYTATMVTNQWGEQEPVWTKR